MIWIYSPTAHLVSLQFSMLSKLANNPTLPQVFSSCFHEQNLMTMYPQRVSQGGNSRIQKVHSRSSLLPSVVRSHNACLAQNSTGTANDRCSKEVRPKEWHHMKYVSNYTKKIRVARHGHPNTSFCLPRKFLCSCCNLFPIPFSQKRSFLAQNDPWGLCLSLASPPRPSSIGHSLCP